MYFHIARYTFIFISHEPCVILVLERRNEDFSLHVMAYYGESIIC